MDVCAMDEGKKSLEITKEVEVQTQKELSSKTETSRVRRQPRHSKFVRFLFIVDYEIRQNFLIAGIQTRPVNSCGLWCCMLLPAILVSYNCLYDVSPVYSLMAYLSIGQFLYSLLFILFIYVSCLVLRDRFSAGCVVTSVLATVPLHNGTDLGSILSFALVMSAIYPYYIMLKVTLVKCPMTFTVGEAMIVSQGIVLCAITVVADVYYSCSSKGAAIIAMFQHDPLQTDMLFIKTYIYTTLSTVGLVITVMYLLRHKRTVGVLCCVLSLGAVYALAVIHVFRGLNAIPEFLQYVFMNSTRKTLFFFWLFLVGVSVAVVATRSERQGKASTEMRKIFHILASLVFLSGILTDVYFTMLAAGMIFGLVILVEAIRVLRIKPISEVLQVAFTVYSDEKDCGVFAMTPIYLYVGLTCPFILVPWREGMELELLSGVLSIGVGDTAASWFGSRYGLNKWPNGSRTIEGTACNIATQLIVVYVLQMFDLLQRPNMMFRTIVAALTSGLVEAQINQVDNLILPLVTIMAFQATCFLA